MMSSTPPLSLSSNASTASTVPVIPFQVFGKVRHLTCFDISKNMLARTRDAVGEDLCAGGEKVTLLPFLSSLSVLAAAAVCSKNETHPTRNGIC